MIETDTCVHRRNREKRNLAILFYFNFAALFEAPQPDQMSSPLCVLKYWHEEASPSDCSSKSNIEDKMDIIGPQ